MATGEATGEVALVLPPLEAVTPTVSEVADMRGPLGRGDHLTPTAQRHPVHIAVHLRAECVSLLYVPCTALGVLLISISRSYPV